MVKQLIRVGNSCGLVIDRRTLRRLELAPNGLVTIRVRDGALIVRPYYRQDQRRRVNVVKTTIQRFPRPAILRKYRVR